MDTLFLHRLNLDTTLGVWSWERVRPQTVEVSLDLRLPDENRAGVSDDLADAVDYADLTERLRRHCAPLCFSLVEALAEEIARFLLDKFAVAAVTVRVVKKGILSGVGEVGVEISRARDR